MANLSEITSGLDALIGRLSAAERRQLAKTMGKELAKQTRKRLAAQLNPDGSPFAPRKPRLKARQGQLRRRAMFSKMRTARLLKLEANADAVSIGFTGRVARIARVHQEGGRDRVSPHGPVIQYARRELLGITPQMVESLRTTLIRHLSG